MDVEMKYGILAVVALLDFALLVRAMVLRGRLFRRIAFLREGVQETRESISSVWLKLLLLNRQGKIEVLHEWHFRSYEAGLEERLRLLKEKPGFYSRFRSWLLKDQSDKLAIDNPADWPFRLFWLGVFALIPAVDMLIASPISAIAYTISLSFPWNGVKNLQISVAAWEELSNDYRRLDEALSKYLERAPEQSERRRMERERLQEEERQRKLRLRFEQELASIRSTTRHLVRHHQRMWAESIDGSLVLDPAKAVEVWDEMMDELDKLGLEPEEAIAHYQVVLSSFDSVVDNKPPVQYYMEKVVAQEAHLNRVIENLQDVADFYGHEPQKPGALTRAARLLVKKVPALWYNLEWETLEAVLQRVRVLLDQADGKIHQLRAQAQLILPIQLRVVWLLEMQKILTDIHHVPVEGMKEWETAQALFKKQIPTAWKAWDEKKLNELVAYARKILELRTAQLATRVGEEAEARKYTLDQPEEAINKLRQLQRDLFKGPEDQPIPVWQPIGKGTALTGDVLQTEGGAIISTTLSDAWNGTDAKRNGKSQEDEGRPTNPLDAYRQSQERFLRKRRP